MRKKASLLFFLRILKVFLSILNLTIAAKYFGVSLDRDIWILALTTILVVDMAIWGPINETFRAKYITTRELEGEAVALEKMNSLLLFTSIVSLGITLIVILFSDLLAQAVAPGFKGNELLKLSNMFIYVAPILLINQLIQIGISVLNAYDIFFIPEIASFGTSIFNIVLTVILAPIYGVYSLAIAYYVGVFLLLGLVVYYVKKLNKNIIRNLFSKKPNTLFLPFLIFALPFFLPYFFGQANTLFEKSLASKLFVGAISSIDYARKFSETFNTVISSVLTTMLIPVLALHYSKNEKEKYVAQFIQMLRLGFLVIILMVTVFTISPNAFVTIVYPTLSYENSNQIAKLITFYSWGALPIFVYVISGIALMTYGKSKIYAIFGMVAQILNIVINWIGYKQFGLSIFPLSLFFSHLICGGIMLYYFPVSENNIGKNLLKAIGIFIWTLTWCFCIDKMLNLTNVYLEVLSVSFGSMMALIVALVLFKMEEAVFLKKLFLKKK
ncbi:lipid II flippase MurJ [Pedobacter xixiisoli]|uniref:Peptidoglycan biosynthesis protein MviN/MurJ, putative lipid II flippase n=1 Tax=Pedobacter xixiisoli TaxID=1476464 RepID=A0A286AEL7_9SPHI|nr:lipid II flippase MurJ [Pedobacter xixiisoli]SOD20335.1 Peptidoglycan biosynthesis protein MviN/MurJ, putative lipid II flippase [Pedobacter xixiisoli]